MTGRPRRSGRRSSSTEAKTASQSRWAMTRLATATGYAGPRRTIPGVEGRPMVAHRPSVVPRRPGGGPRRPGGGPRRPGGGPRRPGGGPRRPGADLDDPGGGPGASGRRAWLPGTRLAGREARPGRAEAELLLRGGGQVELAAAHVGAAVDDRD